MAPKAGCWSRPSQTIVAPVVSSPATWTLSVTGAFSGTVKLGAVMVADGADQALVELEVNDARRAVAMKLRAWFTVMNSWVTL